MRTPRLIASTVLVLAAAGCASSHGGGSGSATGPATSLAVGASHACAVLASGAVRCWGENASGELGTADHLDGWSFTPVPVASVAAPARLAAGTSVTCARLTSGAVWCWGWNLFGQLGNGALVDSVAPEVVSGLSDAIDVDAGYTHACAVAGGGAVRCWGRNEYGQLGDPDVATTLPGHSAVPVIVSSVSGAVSVATGNVHSCALLGDASVRCWGGPSSGYPSAGSPYHDPVAVTSLAGVTALAAGGLHSCAVVTDGHVKCWGSNSDGQLGNGAAGAGAGSPSEAVFVTGIASATAVTAGRFHACALLAGGTVACWGRNDRGQLGDGTFTNRPTPVAVTGVAGATAVGAGDDDTCALVAGWVRCWGDNATGQLGLDPSLVQTSAVPVTIPL